MVFFLFAIAAVLAAAWVRKMRVKRQRWLARLQLPGLWICEGQENQKEENQKEEKHKADRRTLELDGDLAAGTYRSSDLGNGTWRLSGHTLLLASDSRELALDLNLLDVGQISLERIAGERRLYNKRSGNVVPLVRRQP